MSDIRLRHSSTPVTARFTESAPQREVGAAAPQGAGTAGAVQPVSAQADRFEAAPVKAKGPELLPGGGTSLQQQIDAAARSKAWINPTPEIQQTTLENCGPAAVAMLTRSAGTYNEQYLDNDELMLRLGHGFVNRYGPGGVQVNDMGFMMNSAGLVIDSAAAPKGEEVEGYVKDRLLSGQKMLALLDGHTLEGVKGAGASPHWVVIDGVDNNGQFVVKDPALGKALSVDAATLRASLESGERETGAAGLLAVEPRNQFGVYRDHGLVQGAAGVGDRPMKNGGGIGSRVASSSGSREST